MLEFLGASIFRRKPPEKWTKNWIFLKNNAPAHWPLLVCNYLAKNNVTMLKNPPY